MKLTPICNLTGYYVYRAVKEDVGTNITYEKNWQVPTYGSYRLDAVIEHFFGKCPRSYWAISTDIVNDSNVLIGQAISECTNRREDLAEANYKIYISSLMDSKYITENTEEYEKFLTTKYFLDLTDEYRSSYHDKENHYIDFSHPIIEKIMSRSDILDKINDVVAIKYNSSFYDDSIFGRPLALHGICFLDDRHIKEELKRNLEEYAAHFIDAKIDSLYKIK